MQEENYLQSLKRRIRQAEDQLALLINKKEKINKELEEIEEKKETYKRNWRAFVDEQNRISLERIKDFQKKEADTFVLYENKKKYIDIKDKDLKIKEKELKEKDKEIQIREATLKNDKLGVLIGLQKAEKRLDKAAIIFQKADYAENNAKKIFETTTCAVISMKDKLADLMTFYQKKVTILSDKENLINRKENIIIEREDLLKRRETELKAEKKRIEDQFISLLAAKKELHGRCRKG